MKPLNPLFIDSTKAFGDKTLSHVQLTDLCLKPGESVFFEIVEASGLTQKIIMKPFETKRALRYQAEIWTEARECFQYRFLIAGEGGIKASSPLRHTPSGNNIIERWDQEWLMEEADIPLVRTEIRPLKPLIENQTSEQMKQLLKDLS